MNLKKKKKGFTLIELMAVIAIIAILAAVLVPTVSGYITRAKKTAVINEVRNVVNAVETYNATQAATSSEIGQNSQLRTVTDAVDVKATGGILKTLEDAGLIDSKEFTSLPSDITYKTLVDINSTTNAVDNITITDGKLTKYVNSENTSANYGS